MRDILEHKRDRVRTSLLFQQRIRQFLEIMISLEMIPRGGVSVRDLRSLHNLPTINTTFALERLMCIATFCHLIELEKLTQVLLRKVTFYVLIFVDHTGRERLLMRLTLEDFFFN